jgi:glycine cleavage system H protein
LADSPEIINDDPYGAGWMIKFKPTDASQWDSLLSGEDYQKVAEAEG